MAALYVILAIGVVILHISRVPAVFAMIFKSAFTPQAATGGIIGSMFLSMKKGVSRGIFSNEMCLRDSLQQRDHMSEVPFPVTACPRQQ